MSLPLVTRRRCSPGQTNPLTTYVAARNNIATIKLPWLGLGDSVSEGSLATDMDHRYVTVAARAVQAAKNPSGVNGGVGFVNVFSNAVAGRGYWSSSAAIGGTNGGGFLGFRGENWTADEVATLVFSGTGFSLHFTDGFVSLAPFTVTIDGGAPITVTPRTSAPFNNRGVYTSPVLSRGSHTVVVTPQATKSLFMLGAHIFDQDESAGLHLWESGHFGWTSGNWVTNIASALTDGCAVIQPKLLSVFLGLNDYATGVNPATYQSNLTTIISTARGYCTVAPSVLVLSPYARSDVGSPAFPISQYVTAAQAAAIAAGDSDFIDLSTVITVANRATYLNADGVHPNDAGHALIAAAVAAKLNA